VSERTFAADHRAGRDLLALLEEDPWRIEGPTHNQVKETQEMPNKYEYENNFEKAEELHAGKVKAAGLTEEGQTLTTNEESQARPQKTEHKQNAKEKPQESALPAAEERRLHRVETAERALSVYTDEDREANLTDCLADAMHWSRKQGIDFDRCLERAKGNTV
jgi:hypothetical protein